MAEGRLLGRVFRCTKYTNYADRNINCEDAVCTMFHVCDAGSRRYRQPACPARSQSQQGAQQQSTLDRRDFMVSLSAGLLMLSAQSKAGQ